MSQSYYIIVHVAANKKFIKKYHNTSLQNNIVVTLAITHSVVLTVYVRYLFRDTKVQDSIL